MFNIGANSGKAVYGLKHFFLDDESDLPKIDTFNVKPGSTAFSISTSQSFMLNSNRQWIKVNLTSGSNGGNIPPSGGDGDGGNIDPGGKPSPNPNPNPDYDGGDIDVELKPKGFY